MRKWCGVLVAVVVLSARQAGAAPQIASGFLTVGIGTLPVIQMGRIDVADYWGGANFTLPASMFSTVATLPVTDPAAFPIAGIKVEANSGAGSFAGGTGVMGIEGTGNLCLFAPCPGSITNVNVPFTLAGTRGIGVGAV
ncbi:hypothetical protein MYXO_01164 [Myxococcaceae bacterium]|nr:hypothetical protein MYXO_01164 [Myxococcaceae bacterium]